MRLIDADKAINNFFDCCKTENVNPLRNEFDGAWIEHFIDLQPTVEAEPIKHGRWIPIKKRICHCNQFDDIIEEVVISYCCSECGAEEKNRYFYCHCGAKMDEKDNEKC